MKRTTLQETLQKTGILVIDGSMSTALEQLGCDLNDSLWTAKALDQQPELVRQVDSGMTIHDFRVVPGPSHTNLIFDAVLPFGEHITEAEAARQIRERVRQMDGGEYYAVVTVENPYV